MPTLYRVDEVTQIGTKEHLHAHRHDAEAHMSTLRQMGVTSRLYGCSTKQVPLKSLMVALARGDKEAFEEIEFLRELDGLKHPKLKRQGRVIVIKAKAPFTNNQNNQNNHDNHAMA